MVQVAGPCARIHRMRLPAPLPCPLCHSSIFLKLPLNDAPQSAGSYAYIEFDPADENTVIFALFCPGSALDAVMRKFALKTLSFDGSHTKQSSGDQVMIIEGAVFRTFPSPPFLLVCSSAFHINSPFSPCLLPPPFPLLAYDRGSFSSNSCSAIPSTHLLFERLLLIILHPLSPLAPTTISLS